ncbi:MAG: hypothetical protein HC813_03945 [Planctomycetes bacterium]|nr:hypothetical protein [Planctomycetota bacterium]
MWNLFARGQEDIAKDKCQQIYNQVNIYKTLSTSRKLPSSLDELATPLSKGSDEPFYKVEADPWGNKYWIERIDNTKFRIWSNGADGAEGSEDDLCYPPMEGN